MHAPSVWGFILYVLSLSVGICLPHIWDAVFLISGFCQWSGDRGVHHVRLASLPYYPEMCGRLQSPVKCQRGALYNLSVQTLPQDTAAVFSLTPQKKRGRIKERDSSELPDSNKIRFGWGGFIKMKGQYISPDMIRVIIRRKREYHDEHDELYTVICLSASSSLCSCYNTSPSCGRGGQI